MKKTSIKLKFRASVIPQKEGTLIFQVIHDRKVRRFKSQFKIFKEEWDEAAGRILLAASAPSRCSQLQIIRFNVEWEFRRLRKIIDTLERSGKEWNLDEVIQKFNPDINKEYSAVSYTHLTLPTKLEV